ncbi:cell division protein FtsZ [Desulforhopalus singaporensis]|uniref:Cell division protein FtsZ n=1 Tax=Desulforhopalus singaporensis TaxID=91360 RepID=A0A1H0UK42_9BACT|nr:cell division protein FtsZ [Desulforhopalus singaporensis]SDP66440.1 cell division protein FtsZ [Desulforhopalus singaporensis]
MPFRMAESDNVAVVKVFGVGGGGGNAINTMVANRLQGVEFIAANTDKQALNQSQADVCLQLGPNITKGLGAGADPETGSMAATESLEEIKEILRGCDMVFVTAGLGGGTGTGAAPVVAKVSKELGALTVAVVTKPFSFEGKFRARNAEDGWQELQKYADTIITVPNDRLLSIMQKNSKLSEMLAMADNVLLQAVKGITDLINVPGLINADFADLKTVMKEVGPAIMGAGEAVGEGRAVEAAKRAIDNQLLEDFGIDGARGLLINISASEETFTMAEFMEASALIQEKVDDDAKVVIGALYDDSLGDEMHVTVIATGVGGMVKQQETITPTEKPQSQPPQVRREVEPIKTGTPAAPNRNPRVARLPSSNFETHDNPGNPKASGETTASSMNWNDDYLETPTYLRKKAN